MFTNTSRSRLELSDLSRYHRRLKQKQSVRIPFYYAFILVIVVFSLFLYSLLITASSAPPREREAVSPAIIRHSNGSNTIHESNTIESIRKSDFIRTQKVNPKSIVSQERSKRVIKEHIKPPEVEQAYTLLEKYQTSHNTCILRFTLPTGREILGFNSSLPTCLRIELPGGTDVYKIGTPTSNRDLHKSYSPISHPATKNTFDLVVKTYPFRLGGGVATYLCALKPKVDSMKALVKPPKLFHGSQDIYGRWKHVGLIAGGTGIAPLFQIASMLMNEDISTTITEDVSLLFMNRNEEDILLRDEIALLLKEHPKRFRVTYSLTSPTASFKKDYSDGIQMDYGRGSIEFVHKYLPPPPSANGADTMIFVCGTHGFVEFWGGRFGKGPKQKDGTRPKVQGPVMGLLKDAGFVETQVFKY